MTTVQQPPDRRAVCSDLGKHDEHDIWWSYREAAVVPEAQVRAEQPGNPWPYHCLGREADLERPCSERYIDVGYGRRAAVLIPCMRSADEPGLMHRGQHQAWQPMPAGSSELGGKVETWPAWRRLWTWHRGGAQGSSRLNEEDLEPCPVCGVLTRPSTDGGPRYPGSPDAYSVPNQNLGGACFDCRLWAERIQLHAAGWVKPTGRGLQRSQRTVRTETDGCASARLQGWSEGTTGAYGDRKAIVTWYDGDSRGPASSLWDMGEIPWWLDDQFPVNAEVEWTA